MRHGERPSLLCAALCAVGSMVAAEEPARSEPATTNVRGSGGYDASTDEYSAAAAIPAARRSRAASTAA